MHRVTKPFFEDLLRGDLVAWAVLGILGLIVLAFCLFWVIVALRLRSEDARRQRKQREDWAPRRRSGAASRRDRRSNSESSDDLPVAEVEAITDQPPAAAPAVPYSLRSEEPPRLGRGLGRAPKVRRRKAGPSFLGLTPFVWCLLGIGVFTTCVGPFSLFFIWPARVLVAFGFVTLLVGVMWFAVSQWRLAGTDTTDPVPWVFRGSAVMFLFHFAYALKYPRQLGPPAILEVIGLVLGIGGFILTVRLADRPGLAVVPPVAPLAAGQPPPANLFETRPREFLSDLQEFDVKAGPWGFAKNGNVGVIGHRIKVQGVASPKGLGMFPPERNYAAVKYRLGRKAARFKAAAAVSDEVEAQHSAPVFEVLGDGRSLWRSAPVRGPRQPQECNLNVSGVDVLELRVHCDGSNFGVHAVWFEPRLLQKADTPDRDP
jgi:hypothetical protein